MRSIGRWLFTLAFGSAGLLTTAPSWAQTPAPHALLGSRGQFAISANLGPLVAVELRSQGKALTTVGIGTNGQGFGLDWFVVEDLSIGGEVRYASNRNGHAFWMAPRVGYVLLHGESTSLWLLGKVGYRQESPNEGPTERSFGLGLSVPYVWHVNHLFFIGVEPFVSTEIIHKVGNTNAVKSHHAGINGIIGLVF